MKALLFLLVFSFTIQSMAFSDNEEIRRCRNNFSDIITEDMSLKFACTDPDTQYTRSTFLALQYDGADGIPRVVICSSTAFVNRNIQSNELILGTGLLRLVGKNITKEAQEYLDLISNTHQSSLQNANCKNGLGELLVD